MFIRLLGAVLGVGAAWLLAVNAPLGMGVALTGPVFASVLLLAAIIAERVSPRPAEHGPRSASITVRRVRDYLPRTTSGVAVVATACLPALLAGTSLTGAPDMFGHPGRAFSRMCGELSSTRTPWPGWFYAGPILLATAVSLLLAALAVRAVTIRPRLTRDDSARRRTGEVIVAAYAVAVLTPLTGCAAIVALSLWRADCPTVWTAAGTVLTGLLALSGLLAWAYAATVLTLGSMSREHTA